MQTYLNIIAQVRGLPSTFDKKHVLANLTPMGQELIKRALNPYETYGIKNFTITKPFSDTDAHISEFLSLLNKLAHRKLTGHAAHSEINEILTRYTMVTARELTNILLKDLNAGIGAKTVNSVFPDLIPTFDCMLASKTPDNHEWKHQTYIVEAKYDGLRAITIVIGDHVQYFSRTGKIIPHMNEVFDIELKLLASKIHDKPVIFDGEIVGPTFNGTMSALGKSSDGERSHLRYVIFDWMPLDQWQMKFCENSIFSRQKALVENINTGSNITFPEGVLCYNEAGIMSYYAHMLRNGYEGVIVKDPAARYQWKRSKSWLKIKPVATYDCVIEEIHEGTGKFKDTMGAITVSCSEFTTSCGSGFTDLERDFMWYEKESYIGKIVEIKGQEITQAKDSSTPSLRFPVFVKLRDDL